MTHRSDLRAALTDSLLVGDGAMSTYLYQQGIPVGMIAEELSLSRPDWIEEVHRQYLEAGARLIETNTYGANRERLSRYGLEGKVSRINRKSVAIARRAAEGKAYVAGAVGSIIAGRVPRCASGISGPIRRAGHCAPLRWGGWNHSGDIF